MSSFVSIRQIVRCAAPLREAARRFSRHESGATAIEYCLVSVFVALAVITAMQFFGNPLAQAFSRVVVFPTAE